MIPMTAMISFDIGRKSSMDNKIKKERAILDAFKVQYSDFPAGESIHYTEADEGKPDFLIGDLCIELTAYTYEHKSSQKRGAGASIARSETVFNEMLRQAQEEFESKNQTFI